MNVPRRQIERARARLGRFRRRVQSVGQSPELRPPEVIAHTEVERLLPSPEVTPRGQVVMTVMQQFDYGDPNRGMAYEELAFIHSFLAMGFEVRRFDFGALTRRFGRDRMNSALLEAAHLWQPDIVFTMLTADELDPGAVRALRQPGRTTINWFADDVWRFDDYARHWAPAFDAVVTTQPWTYDRYEAMPDVRPVLSQWGFDPTFFRKLDRPKEHDVAFVGLPHGDRRQTIARLREAGIDVVTRGVGWPEGRASFREMAELFARSRICLNLSNSSTRNRLQVKGRDFEVPGAGELLLTQANPDLDPYFVAGEEIATYADEARLVEEIRALLADEARRDRIAAAGYARAHREHTYARRFEAIFNELGIG